MKILNISEKKVTVCWEPVSAADGYRMYWSDRDGKTVKYRMIKEITDVSETVFTLEQDTSRPHYLKLVKVVNNEEMDEQNIVTPVTYIKKEQSEELKRGLIAIANTEGVFLGWRLFKNEVVGSNEKGNSLIGMEFNVYRNGSRIARVSDSCNYLDRDGKKTDTYQVAPVWQESEYELCDPENVHEEQYIDIPLQRPADGITPAGDSYTYAANDMSVADVDGDGEYEYFVKWDPSNSQDVSIKGYTGKCYVDCYKLDGRLLWRLDMGVNIRAGAHYTQFMCYDFNGDGKAEMSVKTAPGTKMTIFAKDGSIAREYYVTLPQEDINKGITHQDNYVCSAKDYRQHMISEFLNWNEREEVRTGQWPATLEECFGIEPKYSYPLNEKDAEALVDHFFDVYAPSRSPKNDLRKFEGFIFKGPEYLTMFGGDGSELQTIEFPVPREDDGLLWGDYAMKRIEPCNRVDRFLSGVAYLDGKRPYLLICRGYYTRATITAYSFFEGKFEQYWKVDTGFVPMSNPFNENPHEAEGTDPIYGKLAGQGNHSLSVADIDGDGCMELIYGGACIDHDGTIAYSSYDNLPDGRVAKLGHGDAMHVADIDPDRPGLEIFNVFEGAEAAPYGFALRSAEDGKVIFGEYATKDLGRCMVGDVDPDVRGLQCWVNTVGLFDCHGNQIQKETPGTNMSIRWDGDCSTQITDGEDYLHEQGTGKICNWKKGVVLDPLDTITNNGTKGNPCLVADIFGDFREEILLRTKDSSAIRIYTNIEITDTKLFTMMHDMQYRCGVAWQNNCYNQPCYPSFYYASDMDFAQVLPEAKRKPVIYIAGDSTAQSYSQEARPQFGWGEMFLQAMDDKDLIKTEHRTDSPFEQEMCYENRHLIVDNCAMAGRSTKTFREEGRLADIEAHLKAGDYLLIQFGHNDAGAEKPERYVPIEEFAASLGDYINAAKQKGAIPVLISSICLRMCTQIRESSAYEIAQKLPEYAKVMEQLAEKEDLIYIDMGAMTQKACDQAGEKVTSEWYREDNVHLAVKGAELYAKLLAEEFLTKTEAKWRI